MRDVAGGQDREVMAGERQSRGRRQVVVLQREGAGIGRSEDSSIYGQEDKRQAYE